MQIKNTPGTYPGASKSVPATCLTMNSSCDEGSTSTSFMKHTSVIGGGSYQVKSASMHLYVAYVAPQAHLCSGELYPCKTPIPFSGTQTFKRGQEYGNYAIKNTQDSWIMCLYPHQSCLYCFTIGKIICSWTLANRDRSPLTINPTCSVVSFLTWQ